MAALARQAGISCCFLLWWGKVSIMRSARDPSCGRKSWSRDDDTRNTHAVALAKLSAQARREKPLDPETRARVASYAAWCRWQKESKRGQA